MKLTIKGNINCSRNKDICACCDNKGHIYGIGIVVPKIMSEHFRGLKNETYNDYISEFLSKNKLLIHGKKVKITIEIEKSTAQKEG